MPSSRTFKLGEHTVKRGQTRDLRLEVSESYVENPIEIPVRVIRAKKSGPTVAVTAAVHGDEINGTGIIHDIMYNRSIELIAGTLILVPVVNAFGFEQQNRYMPDRRDLNRSFPGNARGSLSARVAHLIFKHIVKPCDYVIDLHSAAAGRVNVPNIRADLAVPQVRRIARAFGCELIVNGAGPEGSLRRQACQAGVPTIILEAGEPSKIEPRVLAIGVRGIRNVLIELGMMEGEPQMPAYQARVDRTAWLRAQVGGLLRFHVQPGEILEKGQPIATNSSVFGRQRNTLISPMDGVVLSMTTLPVVKPGEPVCHLAIPRKRIAVIRNALSGSSAVIKNRPSTELASRQQPVVDVTEPEHEPEPPPQVAGNR
ncbi:MAG: succinylglutamate desuccinylase/aspartoacylase family protein [Phycisphaeraceae bacterium]|nr:succinylglutamate desuccinylase/aspartoacylase family protein [Phycisphaeraceae bacterium]